MLRVIDEYSAFRKLLYLSLKQRKQRGDSSKAKAVDCDGKSYIPFFIKFPDVNVIHHGLIPVDDQLRWSTTPRI